MTCELDGRAALYLVNLVQGSMPIQFTGHAKRSTTCPGFEPGACIYLTASTTKSSQLVRLRPIDNLLVKAASCMYAPGSNPD